MMPQLSKEIPYSDTKISSAQSKVDIEAMLKEFGAEALRWTETPESMKGLDCPTENLLRGPALQQAIASGDPLLIEAPVFSHWLPAGRFDDDSCHS